MPASKTWTFSPRGEGSVSRIRQARQTMPGEVTGPQLFGREDRRPSGLLTVRLMERRLPSASSVAEHSKSAGLSANGGGPAVVVGASWRAKMVESRCGAVSVGRTYLFPPLSSGGALVVRPWLRFHIP